MCSINHPLYVLFDFRFSVFAGLPKMFVWPLPYLEVVVERVRLVFAEHLILLYGPRFSIYPAFVQKHFIQFKYKTKTPQAQATDLIQFNYKPSGQHTYDAPNEQRLDSLHHATCQIFHFIFHLNFKPR